MMYGYGSFGTMMGGIGILGVLTWLVLFVDLVLLGVWLWRKISREK